MILQALTSYYEQLLKQGKVEAPGWDSKFKVSYELRLGPDGQLLALNDLRQEVPKGKKTVTAPRELPVPHRVKRASGVAANFLCDNTSYLLGADEKGKPERSRQCFEACAALHHKVLDGVDSPAAYSPHPPTAGRAVGRPEQQREPCVRLRIPRRRPLAGYHR